MTAPSAESGHGEVSSEGLAGPARAELYPNYLGMIIAEDDNPADEYDLIREQLLAEYGYNTARAYWGDLEDWRYWCETQEPPFHPLDAETEHIARYLAELENAEYSPNTRARRLTSLRLFYSAAVENGTVESSPADPVPPVPRRKRSR